MRSTVLLLAVSQWCLAQSTGTEGALTIPFIAGELATPEQLHRALAPAWTSLVDERNSAGLVPAKEEGKPQPPLSKEETAFQYARVQQGSVDSARLLLVFGLVPAASYLDEQTAALFKSAPEAGKTSFDSPAVVDAQARYPDGSTALHLASTFGIVDSARALLDARADVAAVASTAIQPIHAASIAGHAAIVELLASRGADVDAPHSFAASRPLHFAAEMGHTEVARALCSLRADVEAEKKQGGTALHVAADTNNAAVARVLVDSCGADPDATLLGDTAPLYLAAGRGFPEVVDVLIEAGAKPDRTLWPRQPARSGKSKKGGKTASKALQQRQDTSAYLPGSDPDAPGWEVGNGATALHNACENGHLAAAAALLDGGARQLATMEGVTPLIIALQYRHPRVAAALLDHATPANVHVAAPRDGQTALHIAAGFDFPEVAARILRAGGDPSARDRLGRAPLEYATGALMRFMLTRFHGRVPALDLAQHAPPSGGDGSEEAEPAPGVESEARQLYARYTSMFNNGNLQYEAGRLARSLKEGTASKRDHEAHLQQFNIARFILAGGDAPIAVEAMHQKTEAGMHVGLALLGVKVRELEYKPDLLLRVNGHDVRSLVDRVVQAAVQSSGGAGDAEDFGQLVEQLRDTADGLPPGRGASGITEEEEGSLEL